VDGLFPVLYAISAWKEQTFFMKNVENAFMSMIDATTKKRIET